MLIRDALFGLAGKGFARLRLSFGTFEAADEGTYFGFILEEYPAEGLNKF